MKEIEKGDERERERERERLRGVREIELEPDKQTYRHANRQTGRLRHNSYKLWKVAMKLYQANIHFLSLSHYILSRQTLPFQDL